MTPPLPVILSPHYKAQEKRSSHTDKVQLQFPSSRQGTKPTNFLQSCESATLAEGNRDHPPPVTSRATLGHREARESHHHHHHHHHRAGPAVPPPPRAAPLLLAEEEEVVVVVVVAVILIFT
ncbi:hypothetical protein E2C01_009346 [Portunus trituberculatus]|uniref:Uncharacterized protein n=1 Tax=Portunus trituberculatus TaxID=210409 RepID=A0A5B7D4A9_PORTR|nr:hypothetical protein [Portunus trituberculatus]